MNQALLLNFYYANVNEKVIRCCKMHEWFSNLFCNIGIEIESIEITYLPIFLYSYILVKDLIFDWTCKQVKTIFLVEKKTFLAKEANTFIIFLYACEYKSRTTYSPTTFIATFLI